MAAEDFRCKGLLDSALNVTHDLRYKGLHRRADVEVEDSRCGSVAIAMKDPRCKGLSSK
jgi:hypothetical protein